MRMFFVSWENCIRFVVVVLREKGKRKLPEFSNDVHARWVVSRQDVKVLPCHCAVLSEVERRKGDIQHHRADTT